MEEHLLAPLFVKRNAFKHESEYRIVVWNEHADKAPKRLGISIDPHELILSVLVDPRAAEATVEVFKFFLQKKLTFKGRIAKSELYEKVEPFGV